MANSLRFRLIRVLLLVWCVAAPAITACAAKKEETAASAGPRLILIIRHAEKPEEAKDQKDENLSKRGYERAAALVKVFTRYFPRPDFLIATKRSAHSNRPVETIEPLSKAIKEPIDSTFKDEEVAELAHKLLSDPKYSGKVVLIAWHHGKIPELAHALGATDAPDKWDGGVFDRVWQIERVAGKRACKDLPQKALGGDTQE